MFTLIDTTRRETMRIGEIETDEQRQEFFEAYAENGGFLEDLNNDCPSPYCAPWEWMDEDYEILGETPAECGKFWAEHCWARAEYDYEQWKLYEEEHRRAA